MDYNTNLANLAVFPTLDPLSDFDADNAPPPPAARISTTGGL